MYIPVPAMPVQFAQQQMQQMPQGPMVLQNYQPMRGAAWPQPQNQAVPEAFGHVGGQSAQSTPSLDLYDNPAMLRQQVAQAPAPAAEEMPIPAIPGLERHFSTNSQLHRLHWTVTEKRLRSTDKVAVSPSFQIYGASWRIMLQPCVMHGHKGGSSFKAAKGRATIALKCESKPEGLSSLTMMFRFFVGSRPPRGPGTHDFMKTAIATLSTNADWDLMQDVEAATVTVGCELWQFGM